MCFDLFLVSQKELPVIPWNEEHPGFYIVAEPDVSGTIREILGPGYYYGPRSFMGCTCGLLYDSPDQENGLPDREKRVKDIRDMCNYLRTHLNENTLALFSTYWNHFREVYPEETMNLSNPQPEEFDLEEDVIYRVVM